MFELHHEAVELLKNKGFNDIRVYLPRPNELGYFESTLFATVEVYKYAFGERCGMLKRIPESAYLDYDRRTLSMEIANELIRQFETYRMKIELDLRREIAKTLQPAKYVSGEVIHSLELYDDGPDGGIGIVHLVSHAHGHKYVLFNVDAVHDDEKVRLIRASLASATHGPIGWHYYALDVVDLVRDFKERMRFEPRYLAIPMDIDEWSRMPAKNLYRQMLEGASKRGYIDTDDADARRYCEHDIEITKKMAKDAINSVYGTPKNFVKRMNVKETEIMPIHNDSVTKCFVFESADYSRRIKDVIFNDPAVIVLWKDGTKTVVKATNEAYDPEKGLAMAIAKKALGNKHEYYNTFKKWLKRAPKKEPEVADANAK